MADLSLQLQADNLPSEDLELLLVEGLSGATLARLKTGEHILLEGCRGAGKTMLMRTCAARLHVAAKAGGKTLGVHATFKRYLATLPPPGANETPELGTFKAWVNARILSALTIQIRTTFGEKVLERTGRLREIPWTRVISILETTYRGGAPELLLKSEGTLTDAEIIGLQGYTLASELIEQARRVLALDLIVFLLDDAAHALDTRAQGAFFTLIKSLYAPGLAFKISVYPAVTRYGVDFSYGHDAVVVPLGGVPYPGMMEQFLDMLQKRASLATDDAEGASLIKALLDSHSDWVKLLVYCANGNPRSVFKIIAQILTQLGENNPRDTRYEDVRLAVHSVIDRHLEQMVPGVIKDLDPRLLKASEELLERFRDKFRTSPGPLQSEQPRMFLAISNSLQIPYLCMAATRLLVAANVLTYAGPQRLSSRENGSSYLLHPGFVYRDNVLGGGVTAERWLQHFDAMSSRVHAEISKSAVLWEEVRGIAMDEPSASCVNGHPVLDVHSRCEVCTARVLIRSPVAILLDKPVGVLDLTDRIKDRLRSSGFTTVRRVFEATDDELDDIPYVGDKKLREIRSAVEAAVDEYVAG